MGTEIGRLIGVSQRVWGLGVCSQRVLFCACIVLRSFQSFRYVGDFIYFLYDRFEVGFRIIVYKEIDVQRDKVIFLMLGGGGVGIRVWICRQGEREVEGSRWGERGVEDRR